MSGNKRKTPSRKPPAKKSDAPPSKKSGAPARASSVPPASVASAAPASAEVEADDASAPATQSSAALSSAPPPMPEPPPPVTTAKASEAPRANAEGTAEAHPSPAPLPPPPKVPSVPVAARSNRDVTAARASEPEGRLTPLPAGVDPPDPESEAHAVATQIRELEERLDRMIDEAARSQAPGPVERASSRPPPSARAHGQEGDGTVFETARELLSTDFYLRKWGRLGMRNRSEEVDDFGFDPVYEQKVLPFFNFLYENYFRVDTDGIENIPKEGRCLLVANHSGTLPYDGVMLRTAVKRAHSAHRDVRWLAEDFIFHFPFLGSFSNRIGAVRACQENAERLLRKESLVAVFPEGVKGIGKLFKERYRLQRFGRGGFIKLCLRTGTPIVPVAVIGAEEASPMLARIEYLSKAVGLPYFPVTPTFPLLGPLGLVPAPTKWRITFGEAIRFDGHGPDAAEDEILVGRLAERVRTTIQAMLDKGIGERKSVFFG